jgi:membrane protein required for colicin V production
VQLAAFSDDKGANALAGRLKRAGYAAYTEPVKTSKGTLWRVRVGPYRAARRRPPRATSSRPRARTASSRPRIDMTAFDVGSSRSWGFSTLFAFVRGVIRELIALVRWVVGLVAAVTFTPRWAMAAGELGRPAAALRDRLRRDPDRGAPRPAPCRLAARQGRARRGLGFVDRFLGSIFGLARGLLLVIAVVLLAGLTGLPRSGWWQDSLLAGPLVAAALGVAAYLPPAWAAALDYSSGGQKGRPDPQKA